MQQPDSVQKDNTPIHGEVSKSGILQGPDAIVDPEEVEKLRSPHEPRGVWYEGVALGDARACDSVNGPNIDC
jgi:hypothetical protein